MSTNAVKCQLMQRQMVIVAFGFVRSGRVVSFLSQKGVLFMKMVDKTIKGWF
jgi:hypothetical protein